jgi:glycosyltransferase involved in cell wall biosynthesis
MARLLVVASEVPANVADGWHMRIFNLCRVAGARHEVNLFVVPVGSNSNVPEAGGIFDRVDIFSEDLTIERSGGRVLRTTDADYLRRWSPDYYAAVREHLARLCEDWDIDVIVNCSGRVAEVPPTLGVPCMIDITDCRTLTLERRLANRETHQSLGQRLGLMLKKWRVSKREQALVRAYDIVATIGRQDRQRLVDVSGKDPDHVLVIPNGVAEEALAVFDPERNATRSVVFWGNLDFPPNRTAISYFHEKIYAPLLADRGIEWHIVGGGAGPDISRLAEEDAIHLHGYVDDLYGFIADKGVMINPMVEGSGLKNKVLEAFAAGLPVVSTSMGIEAIDAADGEHYLAADTARGFADQLLRLLDDRAEARRLAANARQLVEASYTWDSIGLGLDEAIHRVLPGRPGDAAAWNTRRIRRPEMT